jgi:uroporphyrinogen-III synthase
MEIVPVPLDLHGAESNYKAVLLTSGNAVEALVASGLSVDVPVFCVGDATARRLASTSFHDVRSASGDVDDLLELVIREITPGTAPILYLSGMMISADIGSSLRTAGFEVDRRVVYRAQAIETLSETALAALPEGEVDGVLLYSQRSARLFLEHLKRSKLEALAANMTAYCISHAAADLARELAWRKVAVASRPNQVDLLALLPN